MSLIIQPSVAEPPSVANMIELARASSYRVADILVQDENGEPVDIVEETPASGESKGALDIEITDMTGTSMLVDYYYPKANPPTERIIHRGTGRYVVKLTPTETSFVGTFLLNWHARVDENGEDTYRTQVMQVVSPRVLSILPAFRLMIDKVVKKVVPEEMCYLGYTDSMLVIYLMQGLSYINGRPPYPVWSSLEQFPIEQFSNILLKSALYVGITSQSIFAIDTDVQSYNDQGHSFVLQHFPSLNNMLSRMQAELDKNVPEVKRKFVRSGTASVETRLGYMWYNLIASSPNASTFRNYYFNG